MTYTVLTAISFSIVLPAIIGWIRYRLIHPDFYPFLYCLWIGLVNECISFGFSRVAHPNAVNNNIYVLIESLLIIWQFRNWGSFARHRHWFTLLSGVLVLGWISENLIIYRITQFSSWFRIGYSFLIVLLSIHTINRLIAREKKSLLRNPILLICLSFITYYTFKVLVEAFWVYGLNEGREFRTHVYSILAVINLLTNFIYALAVLWMPTKQRFTMPY